jgi:DNA processing protein
MAKTWSDDRCGWLALHLTPGLGNIAGKNLLERFGDPERILGASLSELMQVEGLRKETARNIVKGAWTADPPMALKRIEGSGARIVCYSDTTYPQALKTIHDPPLLLYVKGKEIPPNAVLVAVVGSRNPTPYGLKAAEEIAQGLARRGLGIVSGLARGIDSAAHRGCLGGKGFTVAVLGTGIDIVYPGSNKRLFQEIAGRGTLISEFPPGTPPEPRNFPIRNRVISGLSRAVTVVEATRKSGSLITASLALEQGREVFAVPGSINSFKSRGCHLLIKQGAGLVENSDDIMNELRLNYEHAPVRDTFKEKPLPPMDADEKAILDIVGDYPLHIDEIVRQGGYEPGQVLGILMRMELKGIVRQLPGKMFVR